MNPGSSCGEKRFWKTRKFQNEKTYALTVRPSFQYRLEIESFFNYNTSKCENISIANSMEEIKPVVKKK